MSWRSTNDKYRAALALDGTAVGAGSYDVQFAVPADWDQFWNNVQSTGKDVRVCTADGRTAVSKFYFDGGTFDTTTRTCVIDIQAVSVAANVMTQLWLYWGDSSLTIASSSFSPSSPKSAYIDQEKPGERIVRVLPERPGDTRPVTKLVKTSTETVYVWFDLRAYLLQRSDKYNNRKLLEEISYVSYSCDLSGSAQAAMVDATKTRFSDGWVKVLLKGGSSGSQYTINLSITTTEGRVLNPRAMLYVADTSET